MLPPSTEGKEYIHQKMTAAIHGGFGTEKRAIQAGDNFMELGGDLWWIKATCHVDGVGAVGLHLLKKKGQDDASYNFEV